MRMTDELFDCFEEVPNSVAKQNQVYVLLYHFFMRRTSSNPLGTAVPFCGKTTREFE